MGSIMIVSDNMDLLFLITCCFVTIVHSNDIYLIVTTEYSSHEYLAGLYCKTQKTTTSWNIKHNVYERDDHKIFIRRSSGYWGFVKTLNESAKEETKSSYNDLSNYPVYVFFD